MFLFDKLGIIYYIILRLFKFNIYIMLLLLNFKELFQT